MEDMWGENYVHTHKISSRAFSRKDYLLIYVSLPVLQRISRTCVTNFFRTVVLKHCALAKIVRRNICHLNLFSTNFGSFCKARKTGKESKNALYLWVRVCMRHTRKCIKWRYKSSSTFFIYFYTTSAQIPISFFFTPSLSLSSTLINV